MNDFDRFLEFELRRMLDPVVTREAPRRSPSLAVTWAPLQVAADVLPAVEPVAAPALRVRP